MGTKRRKETDKKNIVQIESPRQNILHRVAFCNSIMAIAAVMSSSTTSSPKSVVRNLLLVAPIKRDGHPKITTPHPHRRSSLKSSCTYDGDGEFGSSPLLTSSMKTVNFELNASVRKTLSHKDMTEEEKENSWLQPEEQFSIRQRCKQLAAKIEKFGHDTLQFGASTSNTTTTTTSLIGPRGGRVCSRGLESYMRSHAVQKRRNRWEAKDEVFYEQEEQSQRGYVDEHAIAMAYNSISFECQKQAERRASLDRTEIKEYLQALQL